MRLSGQDAFFLLAAYMLGAIPFSFLVARGFGVADVRRAGSGNVGATNVARTAGRTAGVLAFVLDSSKGLVAVLLAQWLKPNGPIPALAAGAAVFGHMYPVWLQFRGGKGVATGAGAFLPLAPAAIGGAAVAFVATVALSRYVSLGSMVAATMLAALSYLLGSPSPVWGTAAVVAVLVVFKHRGNLRRIREGTESRLGARPS